MELLNESLVFPKLSPKESKDVISMLGNTMKEAGFVKESYVSAVLERENIFPTGLQAGDFGVAIPHTDSEHVLESAVAVATLEEPVTFQSMIDPESSITVSLVFLLAVNKADNQVSVLQNLMSVFKDEETMKAILNATKPNEIIQLLSK